MAWMLLNRRMHIFPGSHFYLAKFLRRHLRLSRTLFIGLTLSLALKAEAGAPFTFSPTGSLLTERQQAVSTLLSDGRVLAMGGADRFGRTATAEIYNPATGAWTPTDSMLDGRVHFTATLLRNGKVLVAGGTNNTFVDTAELYDPATGVWTATGNLNAARAYHTATLLSSGKVLLAGGQNEDGLVPDCELYDPTTGIWTTGGSILVPRYNHAATLLA